MNHYAVENLFGIEGLNIAWYGSEDLKVLAILHDLSLSVSVKPPRV